MTEIIEKTVPIIGLSLQNGKRGGGEMTEKQKAPLAVAIGPATASTYFSSLLGRNYAEKVIYLAVLSPLTYAWSRVQNPVPGFPHHERGFIALTFRRQSA